eukprot:Protomagalhaensia_sp_Gyna_25__5113@NODE_590_length_3048_cov_265_155201_g457_i0_p1_GENE_NODE_590_length_3048_cov_265_155201_g457_i0NODE_590_length_3048_cov_265_155201_g457_i0_p1_ORF_typecomplete_len166_score27_10DUF2867/PF11066_8/0_17_NODE_590_length_3048_cov_265_155201_g457_i020672564
MITPVESPRSEVPPPPVGVVEEVKRKRADSVFVRAANLALSLSLEREEVPQAIYLAADTQARLRAAGAPERQRSSSELAYLNRHRPPSRRQKRHTVAPFEVVALRPGESLAGEKIFYGRLTLFGLEPPDEAIAVSVDRPRSVSTDKGGDRRRLYKKLGSSKKGFR